jgi:hypothetical protein
MRCREFNTIDGTQDLRLRLHLDDLIHRIWDSLQTGSKRPRHRKAKVVNFVVKTLPEYKPLISHLQGAKSTSFGMKKVATMSSYQSFIDISNTALSVAPITARYSNIDNFVIKSIPHGSNNSDFVAKC